MPSAANKYGRKQLYIGLCVLAGSLICWLLGLEGWLLFDRELIGDGQWYRLVTGHLAHFSDMHLWANVAVFCVALLFCYRLGDHHFGWVVLLSMVVITAMLWFFQSKLQVYGGLSGVVSALVGWLAVCLVRLPHTVLVGWLLLSSLIIKIGLELFLESARSPFLPEGVDSVPAAHAAGLIAAVIYFFGLWVCRRVSIPISVDSP
ncbi:rhombosortase [Porticoccaceae bacterium LTM1]|nr:rhombosortase [Porticoccaceae bacterium LTM1]